MSEYLIELSHQKICRHARNCSGCFYFQDTMIESLQKQKQGKRDFFLAEMNKQGFSVAKTTLEYQNPSPLFYRHHLDFVLDHGKMGLYHHESNAISDLSECLVLHPKLQDFFQRFRELAPRDIKGSFRLRFDGQNRFGVWLDFANLDIKKLFDEKTFLNSLQEIAFVEIGQRGKSLAQQDGRFKLVDPIYRHWFATKIKDQQIPLNSLVRSFTQSGLQNNFEMISQIQEYYRNQNFSNSGKALEMGAGIGNLTFPFLEFFSSIRCVEFDELSLNGLKLTLNEQKNLSAQVDLTLADFHREQKVQDLDLNDYSGLILNPARSGVGEFLKKLTLNHSIQTVFLMSCYTESFANDAVLIEQAGFRCDKLILFDQFSMSKHFEILSFWSREPKAIVSP